MSRSIRNCNVAVVGGAGFLGSHLVRYLAYARHCKVLVVDNLVTGHRKFIETVPSTWFVHADITTSELHLRHIFEKNKIEYVFNYAASPYVPLSYDRPLYTFAVNATGAMQVINAAQEAGVKGVLQVSSAEVYGGWETNGQADGRNCINENDPVTPRSTYGASKAAIDAWVQVRWREAKTPCIALRQFNCIGERETHPYVVPEIISQMVRSPGTVKLGNNSSRDFLYAGDAVSMAVELLEKGEFGEVYNLGSGETTRVYDLPRMINLSIKKNGLIGTNDTVEKDEGRCRPWEIWHLQSDNTKILGVIGKRQMTSLQEALDRTVQWYLANGNRWPWEA